MGASHSADRCGWSASQRGNGLLAARRSNSRMPRREGRWSRRLAVPAVAFLLGLCLTTSPAIADASTVATTEGPSLATPEMAAATPTGDLMGIGSDGADGVWVSEGAGTDQPAYLTHYSPSKSGLTRIAVQPVSNYDAYIRGIAPGLNGTEWFASFYDNQVSHITAGGKLKTKTLPPSSEPEVVAVDQQGNVWFTERGGGCHLGRLSPAGKLTKYNVGGECFDLTVGPDGNIWIAVYTTNVVDELSAATGEVLASYDMRLPVGIATLGNDVYVTETEPGIVAKIAPSGEVTEYLLPEGRKLEWMTAAPDGAVWFTEPEGPVAGSEGIGRLTPNGELREVAVPSGGPGGIAATNDAIYFTQSGPTGSDGGVMRIPLSNFNEPTSVYVALGDSYSSGEGDPPFEPDSNEQAWDECHRSELAYGPLLDREHGLGRMNFVACSGATTNDLFQPNTANNEPEQLLSLARETKTVTLTIGGDDAGLVEVLEHCVEGLRPGGSDPWPYWQGAECSTNQQLRELVANRLKVLEGTLPPSDLSGAPIHPLSEVLAEIHKDAPSARIVIGGYPKLFGNKASRFPLPHPTASNLLESACIVGNLGPAPYSVLYSDAQWLDEEGEKLDSVIQGAAVDAHAAGIPVRYAPPVKFKSHGLCDTHESWIHPLELHVSLFEPPKVEPGSFHPTLTGQRLGYEPAFAKALK